MASAEDRLLEDRSMGLWAIQERLEGIRYMVFLNGTALTKIKYGEEAKLEVRQYIEAARHLSRVFSDVVLWSGDALSERPAFEESLEKVRALRSRINEHCHAAESALIEDTRELPEGVHGYSHDNLRQGFCHAKRVFHLVSHSQSLKKIWKWAESEDPLRPPESESKKEGELSIDALMTALVVDRPESIHWRVSDFVDVIKSARGSCSRASVHASKAWTTIMKIREDEKLKRLRKGDPSFDRRQRKLRKDDYEHGEEDDYEYGDEDASQGHARGYPGTF